MTAITIVTPSTAYCLADLSHVEIFSSPDLDLAVKEARRLSGPGYLVSARSLLHEEKTLYMSIDGAELQSQDRGDPAKLAEAVRAGGSAHGLSIIDVSTRNIHFLKTERGTPYPSLCYSDPVVSHKACPQCTQGNRAHLRCYILGVDLWNGTLVRHSFSCASPSTHYTEPGAGQFVSLRCSTTTQGGRPMPTPFTSINKLDLNNNALSFDEVEPSEERLAELLHQIHVAYAFSLPYLQPAQRRSAAAHS